MLPFDEIVLAEFEFNGKDGDRPNIVCMCACELRSGREFRLWHDRLGPEPPYRIDDRTLFVAYNATAELLCHLVLGWQLPSNILDLFFEFRRVRNHSGEKQHGAKLLNAMEYFRLDSVEMEVKKHWYDVILNSTTTELAQQQDGILDYCWTDIDALEKLLPAMPIPNLAQALLRGSYARAAAWMRYRGVPIDKPLFDLLSAHWPELRQELINDLNIRHPVFDGPVFKQDLLRQLLIRHGIKYWPLTPTGKLATDENTLYAMADRCPEISELCFGKITLNQLKTFELEVGADGRNRCSLFPFSSKTGRNQPSNSAFAFGLNSAFRSLVKPREGMALVYLDWSGQEFAEAAYFSKDKNMIAAYESGDPYSVWARSAGAMPHDGNKHTHPGPRAVFKRASLGVIYSMGAQTLGEYVGVSMMRAKALLRSHHETFPQYWRWSAAVQDAGITRRELQTVFGWRMRVRPDARFGTLANYPMQGNGSEMLRLACCFAVDRGIPIIAPIHDAILVEGPETDIADIAHEMTRCMEEASRAVLGGPTVRVDASKPVCFPSRYIDGRDGSDELWATTLRLLDKINKRAA